MSSAAERAVWKVLTEARQLTPGPWEFEEMPNGFPVMVTSNGMAVADTYDKPHLSDAAFIAAAREAVPALLADVERLERELAVHRTACRELGGF